MPLRLFSQLRLINTCEAMKLGPSIHSCRVLPVFSRIFPFRLRYLSSGSQGVCIRKFSSRSTRPITRARSGFSSEGGDIGKVRASKSLIEDEAELSDWVSELKTSSLRGRFTSDEDDEPREGKGRSRFQSKGSFPVKRQRESDGDEFGDSTRRRTRNSSEPYDRNSRSIRAFDKKKEDNGFQSRSRGGGFKGREVNSAFGSRTASRFQTSEKDLRKRSPLTTEDDSDVEDEKGEEFVGGFGDLLDEEDSDGESDGAVEVLNKSRSSMFGSDKVLNERNVSRTSPGKFENDSYLSETRFDQCAVSPLTLKGIKDAGYVNMTVVQDATLPAILKGKDVLAKARTGTGKTVAFLLPSIEVVVKSTPIERDQKRPPILVLVICPTRELAQQAASEAKKLLKYHPNIGTQVVIGGTRIALEQKSMQANPCQILVATPGRLRDHLENTPGFATRLMGVKVLVLDEADRLLDMGFRRDIEKIVAAVPKQRQTLLFSATVPTEVRQICNIALKRDHEYISTVEEGSEETHAKVRQMHLIAPLDKQFPLLYAMLKEHIADDADYKVLVFCTTAKITQLVAGLLGELNLNVREIHSRKAQTYRARVSDEFRKSKGLILVTSDVSARGVDYPDVTLVVQVGIPAGREQYIHRLGRTGRKGKEGQGILLLAPWEEFFLSTVKDLPITKAQVPTVDPDTIKKVQRALSQVEMKDKEGAYQSWLGYYNSDKTVGRDKTRLVQLANEFSRSMGLDNPPALKKMILGKMGLRNIPGLRSQ